MDAKRALTAKMRAKAQENPSLPLASNHSAASSARSFLPSEAPRLAFTPSALKQKATSSSLQIMASKVMSKQPTAQSKPQPPPLPSPRETYEISDKEDSDDDEYDSDEEERKRQAKTIPAWARKEVLQPHLNNQFAPGGPDPDQIFGEVETCDLKAIFEKSKNVKAWKRRSSGNWENDRATKAEKEEYRRFYNFAQA